MTGTSEFRAIEIDALDDTLAKTAKRKRIPSLTRDGDKLAIDETFVRPSKPKPTRRPKPMVAPRKAISLEVPDYLATELKIAAATQGVTARHLVLTALVADGYHIEAVDMDEDGRRLR